MSLFLTQDSGRAGLVNSPIFFTVSSPGDLVVGLLNESSRFLAVMFLTILLDDCSVLNESILGTL